jgi:DNA-binding GntR family transcriptional regulator
VSTPRPHSGGITKVERPHRLDAAVSAQLRELIQDGALRPGQELRQEALARELNVSRTPLKNALRDLANEGLVTFDDNQTARVVSLTADEVVDLMEIRELIDGFVARKLAGHTLSSVFTSKMQEIVDQGERDAKLEDNVRRPYFRSNLEFHSRLLVETGHYEIPRLLPIIQRSSQLPYLQVWAALEPRVEESAAEHRGILDAILAGDQDRAEARAREHIRHAAEWAGRAQYRGSNATDAGSAT